MKSHEEVDNALKRFLRQPIITPAQIDAFTNRMNREIKDKDLLKYCLSKLKNKDKNKKSPDQRDSKTKIKPKKLTAKQKRRLEKLEKAKQKKLERQNKLEVRREKKIEAQREKRENKNENVALTKKDKKKPKKSSAFERLNGPFGKGGQGRRGIGDFRAANHVTSHSSLWTVKNK